LTNIERSRGNGRRPQHPERHNHRTACHHPMRVMLEAKPENFYGQDAHSEDSPTERIQDINDNEHDRRCSPPSALSEHYEFTTTCSLARKRAEVLDVLRHTSNRWVCKDRQTDRPTDKQTDKHMHTNTQTHKQTQTHTNTCVCSHGIVLQAFSNCNAKFSWHRKPCVVPAGRQQAMPALKARTKIRQAARICSITIPS
jgi:hypothetical protein